MPRNRNRQPGPILRTLISPTVPTPGTSPALRTITITGPTGPMPHKSRAASLVQPAGDGSGRRSDWTLPASLPYSLSVTTHESRWSQTVTNRSI